jgi:hypothetical protein
MKELDVDWKRSFKLGLHGRMSNCAKVMDKHRKEAMRALKAQECKRAYFELQEWLYIERELLQLSCLMEVIERNEKA